MPSPAEDPSAWERLWKEHPKPWRGLLRIFTTRAKEVVKSTASFLLPKEIEEKPLAFECDQCDRAFASLKALRTHQQVHGVRSKLNAVRAGSLCPTCGKDFRNNIRIQNHWQSGALRCRLAAASGLLQQATEEEQEAAAVDRRNLRREGRRTGVRETTAPPAVKVRV